MPVCASHIRTVESPPPDTTFLPSGEKSTDQITSVWPLMGPTIDSPVTVSQTRITPLDVPAAILLPFGEKATERNFEILLVLRGPKTSCPVCASQIRTSEEPETIYLPSDENEAQRTAAQCPRINRVSGGDAPGREVLGSAVEYAGGGALLVVGMPPSAPVSPEGSPLESVSLTSVIRHVLSSVNLCRVGHLVQGLTDQPETHTVIRSRLLNRDDLRTALSVSRCV